MQNQLLDEVLARHRRPGESEADVLIRLRQADSALTELYRREDVEAGEAYADPLIRAAYLLRYHPHYTLQLGDLLNSLEGSVELAALFSRPRLRHVALCGGPAPEPIALAVLHAQAGGRQLHTTVLDLQAASWRDCWPLSASAAEAFAGHAEVVIDGRYTDLAELPRLLERRLLAHCQLLTLMNGLNELMRLGRERLRRSLAARLDALPGGAVVLCSDQANYAACEQGMALLRDLLERRGARFLLERVSRGEAHAMSNRFDLSPRLQGIYGQGEDDGGPATNNYRIHVHQLQLAAVLPG